MTYENFKTGMFRVCIFLTTFMGALLVYGTRGVERTPLSSGWDRTYIFGEWYSMEVPLIGIPLTIWGTYFFSLWISKGFLGKK
jgi:hypothetical protein